MSYQGLLCLEGTSAEQVISFLLLNEVMLGYLNGAIRKETMWKLFVIKTKFLAFMLNKQTNKQRPEQIVIASQQIG